MHTPAIVLGARLVISVLADLVDTLVATQTNRRGFWLAAQLGHHRETDAVPVQSTEERETRRRERHD